MKLFSCGCAGANLPAGKREANGGVYQSERWRALRHLWLLLIKHDVPLKSAVFHAGTWGHHLHALC